MLARSVPASHAAWFDDQMQVRCGKVHVTGANRFEEGMDVVVEGDAARVTDDAMLHRLAERWRCKYDWHFEVRDGAFWDTADGGGEAYVFAVRPDVVFAYARGAEHTAMRWRFGADAPSTGSVDGSARLPERDAPMTRCPRPPSSRIPTR